jgi:hypothetical protein
LKHSRKGIHRKDAKTQKRKEGRKKKKEGRTANAYCFPFSCLSLCAFASLRLCDEFLFWNVFRCTVPPSSRNNGWLGFNGAK